MIQEFKKKISVRKRPKLQLNKPKRMLTQQNGPLLIRKKKPKKKQQNKKSKMKRKELLMRKSKKDKQRPYTKLQLKN